MNMTKPMKTIVSTAAVCIVIAFASVTTVNAADNDILFDSPREVKGHKHKGHKQMMKRMAKALSLSEEQKAEIKVIKTQAKEQHQTLRTSMKEFKVAEKKLVQAETFDEQAFSALHDTYQPVLKQLALIRVKTKQAIFNVLNTEQQEKWQAMAKHHKGKGKGKGQGKEK
jgi:protein CpxP